FITLLGAAGTGARGGTGSASASGAGTAGSGSVAVASAGVGVQAPLSPELIEHARFTLSRELGPIAKVVLKKALAQARSPQQLHELLAQQIDDPAQRARLLDAL